MSAKSETSPETPPIEIEDDDSDDDVQEVEEVEEVEEILAYKINGHTIQDFTTVSFRSTFYRIGGFFMNELVDKLKFIGPL